eukprot:SAG31_NODE_2337_length_5921_cov_4.269323_7_plen_173_part_00
MHEALLTVGLRPNSDGTDAIARLLERLGLRTAADLQILAGGPEADELLDHELRAAGVSLAARGKMRLLVGQRRQHTAQSECWCGEAEVLDTQTVDTSHGSNAVTWPRRWLQTSEKGGDSPGLSIDTVAIVLSVMIGAVGYVVQAITARRAEQAATELAQDAQVAEQIRQREQ